MSDIQAFLNSRLAEDEQIARAAESASFSVQGDGAGVTEFLFQQLSEGRALADIAAKRAIVFAHYMEEQETARGVPISWSVDHCAICWDFCYEEPQEVPFPCPTVLALAQPYASHPDFDPAWAS